jgi:type I restriction enzyme, S subunit
MSDNNQGRSGYKKTKMGWIPKKWTLEPLYKIASVRASNVDKKITINQKKVFLCNYMDVFHNDYITCDIKFMKATATESEIKKFKLYKNDVIITKDSETREDIAKASFVVENVENLLCGYHLSIIRPNEKIIDGLFLSKLLMINMLHNYFVSHANGVTRFGLTKKILENCLVFFPPLSDQHKIAQILQTWDKAIDLVGKQIEAKQRLKRGLMQQLLTGKLRFLEFGKQKLANESPENWHTEEFIDIFKLIKRKNIKDLSCVLTVSGEYGLIDQEEYFNKSVAGKDLTGYYLLKRNEFAYNRSSMKGYPYGAIKRLDKYDEGVLSSLYICFGLKDGKGINLDFITYYFESGRLNQQLRMITHVGGRAHGLLNITDRDFKKVHLFFPSKGEQDRIANVLTAVIKEIQLLKNQERELVKQKQGLMQKLLTGEVRVGV